MPTRVFNGKGNTRYNKPIYKAVECAAARRDRGPDHARSQPPRPAAHGCSGARGGGRGKRRHKRPRIPAEALAEGGPGIPSFAISGQGCRRPCSPPRARRLPMSRQPSTVSRRRHRSTFPTSASNCRPRPSERRRANSYNVAGLIEGSDPALKAETIVFSGHFDHDGIGPAGHLARRRRQRLRHGRRGGTGACIRRESGEARRSLLFIVFAAEERGLLGSYYYAAHPLRPLATTRAQINFDMIGRNEAADPRVITEISPDTSNELGLIGTHYSPDYREVVERAQQDGRPQADLQVGPRFLQPEFSSAATSIRCCSTMFRRSGGSPASIPTITRSRTRWRRSTSRRWRRS